MIFCFFTGSVGSNGKITTGSTAMVSNSGTSSNAVLNFVLPVGSGGSSTRQPISNGDVTYIKGGNISPSGGMSSQETEKEARALNLNSVTASLLVRAEDQYSNNPVVNITVDKMSMPK